MKEMASVNEVLHGIRQRRQTESLLILTVVATCGLALSLTINFLGMGEFIARGYEQLFKKWVPWSGWIQGWLIFVLTSFGFFCFVLCLKSLYRSERFRKLFEYKNDRRQ
jgi:Mg2+ and Co2+ transporter CorA